MLLLPDEQFSTEMDVAGLLIQLGVMPPPAEFERDKQALLLTIHRFANYPENKSFQASPVFGPLSRHTWGRLMWRHLDHHLRQFGV